MAHTGQKPPRPPSRPRSPWKPSSRPGPWPRCRRPSRSTRSRSASGRRNSSTAPNRSSATAAAALSELRGLSLRRSRTLRNRFDDRSDRAFPLSAWARGGHHGCADGVAGPESGLPNLRSAVPARHPVSRDDVTARSTEPPDDQPDRAPQPPRASRYHRHLAIQPEPIQNSPTPLHSPMKCQVFVSTATSTHRRSASARRPR